jgi:hypothetical protein
LSNLALIDWRLVGFSALWIAGLGLDLAALSLADYEAAHLRARLRDVLLQPPFQVPINIGLLLFCLGLTGTAGAVWEEVVWIGLAAAFAWQAWQGWQALKPRGRGGKG